METQTESLKSINSTLYFYCKRLFFNNFLIIKRHANEKLAIDRGL